MAQASEAVKKVENAEQNMNATVDKQSIDAKSPEAKKNLEAKKLADAKNLADAKRQVDAKKLAETKKQQEAKKLAEAKKKKKPESRLKSMLPRQAANTTRMPVFEPEPIVSLVFPRLLRQEKDKPSSRLAKST